MFGRRRFPRGEAEGGPGPDPDDLWWQEEEPGIPPPELGTDNSLGLPGPTEGWRERSTWTPTHENSDFASPYDWYGVMAGMGHIRTVPTPSQLAELEWDRGGGRISGTRLADRMGADAYDALLRKAEHWRTMPKGDPRYYREMVPQAIPAIEAWERHSWNDAKMPPRNARPYLPPLSVSGGDAFDSRTASWQQLIDELQRRRGSAGTLNGLLGGLRGGGLAGGDDALLGA